MHEAHPGNPPRRKLSPVGTDEDDAVKDWETAPKTVLDDPVTTPHDARTLPGYEVGHARGREAGCLACAGAATEEVFAALEAEFTARGLSRDEIAHISLAIRQRIAPA
jgi:hypothetical protein